MPPLLYNDLTPVTRIITVVLLFMLAATERGAEVFHSYETDKLSEGGTACGKLHSAVLSNNDKRHVSFQQKQGEGAGGDRGGDRETQTSEENVKGSPRIKYRIKMCTR